ncbi:23S rRNA (pseudouridine(1915)-N(3))-methyltransferase RlmH [Solemya velum gill symbiont]|uniref:23S rRNA (pseudouridine(1915)-N(3))-methyltransferase RlmH n=1 Tax=Solemya velum gill symbiont TaxID=2340 RepID=UPI0009963A97|nr:23S rRNA (pseudouridine(1915)-N(3))-methyltransferase RlmH [Solemya velum gill symbiont]OOZ46117.1 23S rRNA (pseudouridine(1915)-N(3))-methyltransferase RlmH [Solemya velum gill symbiont]OOZ47570.1 23S rRNA (pseudouridine(1915)-N(3))-methyltransferase RlmH [Solemya velum gill symbiont]OOZ52652.1 23S rRNA (pseudouridine(1915)-N(3))-methyltransferase RlmH [Solemya velum gill symbiont]OOZ55694.1 23S rRNA (pseudouridine(1915)-N(3))-methyltransferase RlmH [Solemya velum gill symbiont]OOZ57674.1 
MNIHLIAVGTRMPAWVTQGYEEYSKRMPRECSLKLVEIAPGHRGKNASIEKAIEDEGKRMLAAIPKGANVIALDEKGKSWSTMQLSKQLDGWLQQGGDTALLVGGPDGLSASCRASARTSWSLSALTLPHPLVRVLLAEQLYRALSVLNGHPYHRE